MKKVLFFNILSFFLLVAPVIHCAGQKNDDNWRNKPFIRSKSEFKSESELTENNKKIDNKKKNNTVWYKKPAVKYAIGGLTSVAIALYSFRQYMAYGISLPENNEFVEQKVSQDVVQQDPVKEESSQENLEKKEAKDNKNTFNNISNQNLSKLTDEKKPIDSENIARKHKKKYKKFGENPRYREPKQETSHQDSLIKQNSIEEEVKISQNAEKEEVKHQNQPKLTDEQQNSTLTPEQQNAARNSLIILGTALSVALITAVSYFMLGGIGGN